jgi:hypothetical protein
MKWLILAFAVAVVGCDKAPVPSASTPPPQTKETAAEPMKDVAKAPPFPPPQAPNAPQQTPDTRPPAPKQDVLPNVPEFVVPPVEGEPVWVSPSDEKEVTQRGYIPFKGGYIYELKDDKGGISQSGIVVDGTILLDRGVIELLGCGSGGKEYESVLRLDADVQGLDLALSLIGLKRGPIPGRLADPSLVQGSRVLVLLQWLTEDGKTVTHRAEDCIVNIQRKTPMPRVGWTYVGAMLPVPDPAATGGKTYRVLAAAGTRSLLTTYRDPSTLLDNPLTDAIDDSLYVANYMILPPMATKVRVILRAPEEPVKKEIAKLEEELAK